MKITKTSPFSGKSNTREIPVTEQELTDWMDGDRNIQDCLGHLSADDREFLMTGITPEEWEETFGKDHDDTNHDEPFADESKW
jgi:hypothetical protein